MSVGEGTGHVPAWKRLGLKLKRPQEDFGDGVPQDQPIEPAVKKVKTANTPQSGILGSLPASRPKHTVFEGTEGHIKAALTNGDGKSPFTKEQSTLSSLKPALTISETNESKPGSKRKRSKSVTFATDAKAADGDSAGTFPAPSTDPPVANTSSAPTGETGAKSQKKSKGWRRQPETQGDLPLAYVEYLVQFYKDRSSWKFNKSKQIDLFKNLWNLFRIPPQHNDALVAYITGLQGEAAKKRIFDDAKGIIEKEKRRLEKRYTELDEPTPSMESEEARRSAREGAVRLYLERRAVKGLGPEVSDEVLKKQLEEENGRAAEESRRALLIIEEALLDYGEKELSIPRPATTTTTSVKKTRKSRTAVVEESSDSSDSSDSNDSSESDSDDSSDDSSSDSSDAGEDSVKGKPPKVGATKTKAEPSSSSDDSDDSSSTDGDTEEGATAAPSGHYSQSLSRDFIDMVRPKPDYSRFKKIAAEKRAKEAQARG